MQRGGALPPPAGWRRTSIFASGKNANKSLCLLLKSPTPFGVGLFLLVQELEREVHMIAEKTS
jgi:hypothetical protein